MNDDCIVAINKALANLDAEISYVNRLVFSDETTRLARLKPLFARQNELLAILQGRPSMHSESQ
jgi:hypothetical protein